MTTAAEWQADVELAPLTTFGVRARARWLVTITEEAQLPQALERARSLKLPVWILGGGSNVLFAQDYPGVIVHMQLRGIKAEATSVAGYAGDDDSVLVTAAAGENWHAFVEHCLQQGWYGLENLALIPGQVGAAPVQNIGAYGVELADFLESVRYFDREDGRIHSLPVEACGLGYRDSVFKRDLRDRAIIVSCRLKLSGGASSALSRGTVVRPQPVVNYPALREFLQSQYKGWTSEEATPEQVFEAVCAIRRSKLPDPRVLGNGGSFFRNPIIPLSRYEALQAEWPDMPSFPAPPAPGSVSPHAADGLPQQGAGGSDSQRAADGSVPQCKVPAAWLIDQRGWKGQRHGSAGVHDKQPLVLVNHQLIDGDGMNGGATSGEETAGNDKAGNDKAGDDKAGYESAGKGADVLALARKIADDVEQTFGIVLEPEVRIWPDDAWSSSATDETLKIMDIQGGQSAFDAKSVLAVMSQRPGVYRMLDATGEILYVGKARNLRKRVSNYFRASGLDTKTMALVSHIADIDVTVTNSETEALLLEQNLIKKHRPPYNIQLRDDKTYPYIMLTHRDVFPRLAFYRGTRRRDATFFGPYPSAGAVRESLALMQKVFRIRQCEDSFFRNRSRPCLQYQIGRCTAPCVGLISPAEYAQDVQDATLFLQGRSDALIRTLGERMEQKAAAMEYEQAARLRDRVADLRRIQTQQVVSGDGSDADIIAAVMEGAYMCVHVMTIRGGRMIGSRNFFPKDRMAGSAAELMEHFIAQYYLRNSADANTLIPAEILIAPAVEDSQALQEVLTQAAGRNVRLTSRVRAHRARWLELAQENVRQAVQSHINNRQTMFQRFEQLQEALQLDDLPQRIECFDISHTMGESTVAACVVFDHSGPLKSDYRRYNIQGIQGGDDYAAMEQALSRRYSRMASEPGEAKVPDIILIDGGKGQLGLAIEVLKTCELPEIMLMGIAKGISRKAGQETLLKATEQGITEVVIASHSPALHLLQQIRDEAHRFAITGHRQRRAKTRQQSPLEQIPGLGPARRRSLLTYFGGQQEILRASESDLARAPGISKKLAAVIYEALHSE